MYFQQKFFATWQPESGSDDDEGDETSSAEDEDASDDAEDDDCSDEDASDEADGRSSATPTGKGPTAEAKRRQDHRDAHQAPKSGTTGFSVADDLGEDESSFDEEPDGSEDDDESGDSQESDEQENAQRPSRRQRGKDEESGRKVAGAAKRGAYNKHEVDPNQSLASACSLVRNQLRRPLKNQVRATRGGAGIDDVSVDISLNNTSQLTSGRDVMASFGGFLEKRKKDKRMARDSMMSEIDGLVSNLHTDIG